ncbi:hypothetical protein [Pontibacter flavimaris]|uniref:DUF1049 domain-containing protein n=1 Tax=Pontibacter flavimaris TaxID=1797110 RepID=A0A1Q5PG64_9BACT|nr:hypothetical protein [Pontibacter flavimaris]OKL41218.1 hypothetical protein A3841_15490 [Pontibacter flavimaris]
MKALKALLDVLVFGYIIFTVLLLAGAIDENAILNTNAENEVLTLYKGLVAVGGVVMLARVLMSSIYVADLQHEKYRAELKINNLKAALYEKRQAFRSNSYKETYAEEHQAEVA